MSESRRNIFSSESQFLLSRSPRRSPLRGRENMSASLLNVTPSKKSKHHDSMKGTENAMKIFLRVRPLHAGESESCINVEDNTITIIPPTARSQTKVYDFQKVFNEDATQETVFNESFLELLPALKEGRDMLCFAYGVTGAGKTFTIEGTPDNPGILTRALRQIIQSMDTTLTMYNKITVSCFEIFNEKLYDLLAPPTTPTKLKKTSRQEPKNQLTLGRFPDGRTAVEGASEWSIQNESQIMDLLLKANAERHKAETAFNHNSSRSHVVFRILLHRDNLPPVIVSIVDLAGCERTKMIADERFKESCNINKSMLVLGKCIRSLATRQAQVPFRESLITRLFKDFFESPGKCAVAAVIVNVTPAVEQFEDTSFSLAFAVDASECYTSSSFNDSYFDEPETRIPLATTTNSIKPNVILQMQKYLDSIEKCYQFQVTELMERTRCANKLCDQLQETVPREEYEALQRENQDLKAKLAEALETIRELSSAK